MGKIGDGHAAAMARQGLREARASVYPNSNIASQTEYGIYGTKTPGEVADSREGSKEADEEKAEGSLIGARLQQTTGRIDQAQREPGMDR
jgi:hypothetical protein